MAGPAFVASWQAFSRAMAWLHRTAFPSINSTFAPDVLRPSNGEMGLGCIDVPYEIENICCESGEAPALANAIFAATGQRLRELPLRVG